MRWSDFRAIIGLLIHKVIVPLLPIYIFGVFLSMSEAGHVFKILELFLRVIIVVFALQIILLLLQFTVAGSIAKKNPFKLLKNMLPAYFTALGTSSSAATIPVTLDQTLKNGVKESVANFVIPLCATIHLSGSTMKIVAFSMSLIIMQGLPVELSVYAGFIFMLGLTMVAAPGVPGGAIVAALGLLQSMLGFDENMQALMVALYIAVDSFGTACNVTGDGAIAVVIDKIESYRRG
jgi:Na+/H+-dicarboxylate symporters